MHKVTERQSRDQTIQIIKIIIIIITVTPITTKIPATIETVELLVTLKQHPATLTLETEQTMGLILTVVALIVRVATKVPPMELPILTMVVMAQFPIPTMVVVMEHQMPTMVVMVQLPIPTMVVVMVVLPMSIVVMVVLTMAERTLQVELQTLHQKDKERDLRDQRDLAAPRLQLADGMKALNQEKKIIAKNALIAFANPFTALINALKSLSLTKLLAFIKYLRL